MEDTSDGLKNHRHDSLEKLLHKITKTYNKPFSVEEYVSLDINTQDGATNNGSQAQLF